MKRTCYNIFLDLALFFVFLQTVQCRSALSESSYSITDLARLRGGSTSKNVLGARRQRVAPPTLKWPSKRVSSPSAATIESQQQTPQQQDEDETQATKEMMDAFLTRDSRNSFVARVYAILASQLSVTAASVIMFGLYPELSSWMMRPGFGIAVPVLSLIISTIAWMMVSLSPRARRSSPMKWQILTLFTLGEAVCVGFISSCYHFRSVVSALTATTVAATSVSVYTIKQKNPKYDLSQWGAMLSSAGCIFVVYGLMTILQLTGVLPAGFVPYTDMAYGMVGATLFSFYIAYHTKLIVSGKHTKYQLNEQDHVYGAMTLYTDIVNMFIYMLKILGEEKDH